MRLTSFQAQSTGEGVRLSWTSSLEQNFDYYQVERSTDAVDFEAVSPHIASVSGQAGVRHYSWTDGNEPGGVVYYRLKQVDLDNSYTYSNLLGVTFASDDKAVALTPNPFSDELTLTLNTPLNGPYVIELYAPSGKREVAATGEKNGLSMTRTIATNLLPAGIYYVTIRIGDQHFMRKVIKQ